VKKAVGEISKIRNAISFTFGAGTKYTLDSSRVDYGLARSLYDNTEDRYKLGAGFCKPIINAKAGFMGVPSYLTEDEEAKEVLDNFFNSNKSKMGGTNKKALLEGDCFVWITREETDAILYPETKTRLVYNIIPNDGGYPGYYATPSAKTVEGLCAAIES